MHLNKAKYRVAFAGGAPGKWARVARAAKIATRCMLVFVLAVMGVSTAVFSQLAGPRAASADETGEPVLSSPVGISVRAFEMTADDVWSVPKNKKGTTSIDTNGGRLRLCVCGEYDDGSMVYEYQSERWSAKGHFSDGFFYSASTDALSVDSRGVITALKDGVTTITVTPKETAYEGLSASIDITTVNQGEGLVVQKIEIVNAKGKAYGDDAIKLKEKNELVKLYVRVTYKDKLDADRKVVYSNYPDAPASQVPPAGELDGVEWGVGDTNYAVITSHGGVGHLKAVADALTQVYASISGGSANKDTGMGAGIVFDVVGVNISSGATVNGGDPSDMLKVRVIYAEDPDKTIVKKGTYMAAQLEALGCIERTYTLARSKGEYVTDRARGVPLAQVLVDLGIDVADVKYFKFAANDGANPGKITAKWLVRTTRYFFPNYDIGGSLQDKVQVPTMIALEDSWNENTMLTGELNPGTRFRLVFGTAVGADGKLDCDPSKSVKFINMMTIALNGAAPAERQADEPEQQPVEKSDAGQTGGAQGNDGGGAAGGVGSGRGSGVGAGADGAAHERAGGASSTGAVDFSKAKKVDAQTSWRIFQMMNKSNSDVRQVFEENPLAPFAPPAFALVLLMAMFSRYAQYRARLA